MRILLTGGGTGGHLYPLLAVAKAIRQQSKDVEFLYIGPCNAFSKEILEKNNIPTKSVMAGKWRRYFSLKNVLDIFKIPIGIIQALFKVFGFMPDVVFSKGGYGSVPTLIAARIYWIPIIIHESDAVPGKANRFMEHLSDVVATSYKMTSDFSNPEKVILTGIPVRKELMGGNAAAGKQLFKIQNDKPILLVLGGSQGAQKINRVVSEILPRLLETYEIIHQCGEKNFDETEELAGKKGVKVGRGGYHLVPFIKNEMKDVMACSDLILSRAGGSAIAEIAANSKPSILVPISKSANDHQLHNAFEIAKKGGAMVLKEENLTPELLLRKIDTIMNDLPLRKEMGEKAKFFYRPSAAEDLAKIVLKLGSKEKLED